MFGLGYGWLLIAKTTMEWGYNTFAVLPCQNQQNGFILLERADFLIVEH